jgi:hypothetical protein
MKSEENPMEQTVARALPLILDLHNGTLDPALVTESIRRLWIAEDDYSEGSLTFHLALGHFPPPQAVDFYVMALALMNHREAHRVPNLLKLCREDLGLWRAALEMEAGYRGGTVALDTIEELVNAADPFFSSTAFTPGSHLFTPDKYWRPVGNQTPAPPGIECFSEYFGV